jgi:lycopene epsilon-cyclase
VENNPYDPSLMVFMDYRDHEKKKKQSSFNEIGNPTFLYAMPMSSTRVFFEVFCQLHLFSTLYYIIDIHLLS